MSLYTMNLTMVGEVAILSLIEKLNTDVTIKQKIKLKNMFQI